MVAPIFFVVVAGVTVLALKGSQRLAPWFLLLGVLLFGSLWLLGILRIPWPDLGPWTVFVLNPYLFVTLSFVLMIAGAIGTVVRVARRFSRFS
jgi:hypothetical protein